MKISRFVIAVLLIPGAGSLCGLAAWSADGDTPAPATAPAVRPADEKGMKLIWAASKGKTDEVLDLIKQGADVNAADTRGNTPLYYACSCRCDGSKLKIAKILVDHGANVNAHCIGGFTPLQEACADGNPDIVEYLISKGGDVGARDNSGVTTMHVLAISRCDDPGTVIELLIKHGAAINPVDNKGKTPLDYANEWDSKSRRSNRDLLLAKGAKTGAELAPAATQKSK